MYDMLIATLFSHEVEDLTAWHLFSSAKVMVLVGQLTTYIEAKSFMGLMHVHTVLKDGRMVN